MKRQLKDAKDEVLAVPLDDHSEATDEVLADLLAVIELMHYHLAISESVEVIRASADVPLPRGIDRHREGCISLVDVAPIDMHRPNLGLHARLNSLEEGWRQLTSLAMVWSHIRVLDCFGCEFL